MPSILALKVKDESQNAHFHFTYGTETKSIIM